MLTFNVVSHADGKVINGSVNGKKFNVPFSAELVTSLKAKQAELETIEETTVYDAWVESINGLLETKEIDVITTACPDLIKNSTTGCYFVKVVEDGVEKVSKTPVPNKLVSVILESVEKEIDPTPIIKAWIRFLRNPNFTPTKAGRFADYITSIIVDGEEADRLVKEEGFTPEVASVRASYNDVAITQEGLIVTKKYAQLITEGWIIDPETNKPKRAPLYGKEPDTINFQTGVVTKGKDTLPEFSEELFFQPPVMGTGGDEFLSGEVAGHVIQVGKKHTLEKWSQVNTNDYTSCVKGLHVGGWRYVSAYKGLNCQLLECFVDPAEIGAICDISDCSDGAIRVREYFVFGAVEGRNKGIYHSSKYAAMKDAEWAEYKAKAIENSNKLAKDVVTNAEELGL